MTQTFTPESVMTSSEVEILRNEGTIQAIKAHRIRTGASFSTSLETVLAYGEALGIMQRSVCETCKGKGYRLITVSTVTKEQD